MDFGVKQNYICFPASIHTGHCLISASFLNLFELQFLHLYNEDESPYCIGCCKD